MLEALVSSRIRRTLLEYLLSHPNERFYLRGLAKELGLSVSPLRRELKRLERSGVLRAAPEGNILFYTVNAASPVLMQLQGASPASPAASPAPLPAPPVQRPARLSRPGWLTAVAAAAVVAAAGAGYLVLSREQILAQVTRALARQPRGVTVMVPSASGAMRGARWQIVPGGLGGFGGGATQESY